MIDFHKALLANRERERLASLAKIKAEAVAHIPVIARSRFRVCPYCGSMMRGDTCYNYGCEPPTRYRVPLDGFRFCSTCLATTTCPTNNHPSCSYCHGVPHTRPSAEVAAVEYTG